MPKLPKHRREVLVSVLIHHQKIEDPPYIGVCSCGWGYGQLGASWAEHIVTVFEAERRVLTRA